MPLRKSTFSPHLARMLKRNSSSIVSCPLLLLECILVIIFVSGGMTEEWHPIILFRDSELLKCKSLNRRSREYMPKYKLVQKSMLQSVLRNGLIAMCGDRRKKTLGELESKENGLESLTSYAFSHARFFSCIYVTLYPHSIVCSTTMAVPLLYIYQFSSHMHDCMHA